MPPKPAPIFTQPLTVIPSHPNHQHDIVTALVAVETLDTLPGDLTKAFGDLRELDAVLNSTTASLTHKLRSLTRALQAINPDVGSAYGSATSDPSGNAHLSAGHQTSNDSGTTTRTASDAQLPSAHASSSRPLDRFQLLLEIAEELTRYKIGVEDKVRVSGQACDTLIAHQAHLQALLSNSSIFLGSQPAAVGDASHTWDGHTAAKRSRLSPANIRTSTHSGVTSAQAVSDHEPYTSQARNLSVNPQGAGEVTPSKKRKSGKERLVGNPSGVDGWEEAELAMGRRSPALAKKPVAVSHTGSAGTAAKDSRNASKKRSRNSPAESLRGSPAPSRASDALYPETTSHNHLYSVGSTASASNQPHKHAPSRSHSHSVRLPNDVMLGSNDAKAASNKNLSSGGSSKRIADIATSAKRVSSPSIQGQDRAAPKANGRRDASLNQGENRSERVHLSISDQDLTEADHDPTPYCYCQKQSYGEMIGCDSEECRYEWFHLSCLNLSKPPDGTWLCPDCEAREQKEKRSKSKRGGVSGKGMKKRG